MYLPPNGPTVVERLPGQLFLAAMVCTVSAIPSFLWAVRSFDIAAMLLGVGLFICAYLTIWNLAPGSLFTNYYVAWTVRIAYGIRLTISVVFPIGMAVDMIPGMISVNLIKGSPLGNSGFGETLAITLVQGILLHIVIALLALVVYPFVRFSKKKPTPQGLCTVCGYDLRASPERCPECGTPCARIASTMT